MFLNPLNQINQIVNYVPPVLRYPWWGRGPIGEANDIRLKRNFIVTKTLLVAWVSLFGDNKKWGGD